MGARLACDNITIKDLDQYIWNIGKRNRVEKHKSYFISYAFSLGKEKMTNNTQKHITGC